MAGDPRSTDRIAQSMNNVASAGKAAKGSASAGRSGVPVSGTNQYAGYKGPVGTSNPNTSIAPGSYGLSSSETKQYNDAKMEYAGRGFGKRLVDFFSPIKSVDPQINQPSSYAGGQYHHGFNPVGLAVGTVAPYGSGMILGPAAGAAYNSMGGHDVVLTGPGSGFSTSYPDGGPGYNSQSGYAGPNRPPSQPQGKADQTGSLMAEALGGAPFGPQPTTATQTAQTAAQPSMFAPKLPNHTVPYGYQSAFPNSLTDEDKRLLYAQYLTGAA